MREQKNRYYYRGCFKIQQDKTVPRQVGRRRKRPLIEVSEDTIPVLIEREARIVALNRFLGGLNQIYLTVIAGPRSHFFVYHQKPFRFIVQADGALIPDGQEPPLRTRYRPS